MRACVVASGCLFGGGDVWYSNSSCLSVYFFVRSLQPSGACRPKNEGFIYLSSHRARRKIMQSNLSPSLNKLVKKR